MSNQIAITDYVERGNSLYITMEVFDSEQNKFYKEEMRFLDDMLYGDFLHTQRSPLTAVCRKEAVEYARSYFNRWQRG